MKALVVYALSRGFDFEDVQIAAPIGREVLVNVQASGLCHTDLLFATHNIVPMPAVLGHEVAGMVAAVGPDCRAIPCWRSRRRFSSSRCAEHAIDVYLGDPSSANIPSLRCADSDRCPAP